jgi:peptidoglycan hydrolase-like protein with peptidoglycan-binding domain
LKLVNIGGIYLEKDEFIRSIKEGALKGFKDYGILPSLTIAQAILESAWGSSELAQKANNLFGIKALPGWKEKKITMKTAEWYRNKKEIMTAEFRYYDSFNSSIEDHNKLLSIGRYTSVRRCTDYREACQKIYDCGYATDPSYPEKLIKIIEQNKLYEFDRTEYEIFDDKIRRFQKICNELGIKNNEGNALIEDNILGPKTLGCIEKLPVLKMGSKGKAEEFVQELLCALPADGVFGIITKKLVMNYQKEQGINVDGIVGPETWTSLIVN